MYVCSFFVFHFAQLSFLSYEYPLDYVTIDQGIHKIKMKVAWNEKRKKLHGFSFYVNIGNFEVFLWNLNLRANHLFWRCVHRAYVCSYVIYIMSYMLTQSLISKTVWTSFLWKSLAFLDWDLFQYKTCQKYFGKLELKGFIEV